MASKQTSGSRLAFIDWTRGLGALIMLQGHAFHSFTTADLKDRGPYVFSQFLGGMPPAIFLFLAGVTLAFLMESRERQGLSSGRRVLAALRRAGYLLAIAFLFRLQLWSFGLPYSSWTDLFRVDILNCMGLAVALLSVMAVFSTAERARLCAVLGLAIAAASPLVSLIDWTQVHPLIRSYFVPDYLFFGFFPWASYVAFGVSAGSALRLLGKRQMDHALQWAAILGLVLVAGGQFLSSLPFSLYPKSDFWLNSPWQVLMKLGAILLILAFAFLWTRHVVGDRWSWIRQLGMTSLLVYWVHVELVYGRWLGFWKEALTLSQTLLAAIAVILLMLGLSVAKTHWKDLRQRRFSPGYSFFVPRPVSGD